jgi:hypothetical protein
MCYASVKPAQEIEVALGWNREGGSTRGDVSSYRLPAMGIDVIIGTLLWQASLHSVDRTDKYRQLHFLF